MLLSVSYVFFQESEWQLLTKLVLHPSVNIVKLFNELKFLIMVPYTFFTAKVAYVTYVTL